MRTFILTALVGVLAIVPLSFISCKGKSATVVPTAKADSLCPICGMKVNFEDTHWRATILFKDSVKPEFDTPKHAFQYYLNLQEYSVGKYRTTDVDSFFVHDYFTREKISAFTASYLSGSDIRSPMGLDLIPMAEDSIQKYIPVHGGRKVSFGEIDKKLLSELQKGKPIETKVIAKNAVDPVEYNAAKRGEFHGVDPVCGMTVNVDQATTQGLVAQYQGKTYYFCQAFDRDRFIKDPAKFGK